MTQNDIEYVRLLLNSRVLTGPVLELGTGYKGITCKEIVTQANLPYFGTDLEKGELVDFLADFEQEADMNVFKEIGLLGTILVLNVLEHAFNPIAILDNCLKILSEDGVLVVITPTIWPLHNYPLDTWRINPNFYEEYAKRRNITLMSDYMHFVGYGPVSKFQDSTNNYAYPKPSISQVHYIYSKIIHKITRTYGRGMIQPSHLATGVVFRKTVSYSPAPPHDLFLASSHVV